MKARSRYSATTGPAEPVRNNSQRREPRSFSYNQRLPFEQFKSHPGQDFRSESDKNRVALKAFLLANILFQYLSFDAIGCWFECKMAG